MILLKKLSSDPLWSVMGCDQLVIGYDLLVIGYDE